MADALLTQHPCVIVLGMHRSGTSLLTGSLEAAGLYLGEVNNEAPFNRKGNKENESIRELNDALLERNDAAWNRPPNGQARWSGADEELKVADQSLPGREPTVGLQGSTNGLDGGRLAAAVAARSSGGGVSSPVAGGAIAGRAIGRARCRRGRSPEALVCIQHRADSASAAVSVSHASFRIGKCVSGRPRHPVDCICAFYWSERPGGFILRR